jgi:hypothetical protein
VSEWVVRKWESEQVGKWAERRRGKGEGEITTGGFVKKSV